MVREVYVKQARGGYKKTPLSSLDRDKFTRGRKKLWGKRRRYWEPKKEPEQFAEYVRTYLYKMGEKDYYAVDVVIYEPYPGSEQAMIDRLTSKGLEDKIKSLMDASKYVKSDKFNWLREIFSKTLADVDSGYGGASVVKGSVKDGIRDLRKI